MKEEMRYDLREVIKGKKNNSGYEPKATYTYIDTPFRRAVRIFYDDFQGAKQAEVEIIEAVLLDNKGRTVSDLLKIKRRIDARENRASQ